MSIIVPTDPKGHPGSLKTPLQLLPPIFKTSVAEALGFGAFIKGYGAWNWRKGPVEGQTYLAAIMRHIDEYQDGQDKDPESGRCPLAHAAASIAILMDARANGTLVDNRPKKLSAAPKTPAPMNETGRQLRAIPLDQDEYMKYLQQQVASLRAEGNQQAKTIDRQREALIASQKQATRLSERLTYLLEVFKCDCNHDLCKKCHENHKTIEVLEQGVSANPEFEQQAAK